jgi:hypothetical protein
MIEQYEKQPPEFETYFSEKVKVVGYPMIGELQKGMYRDFQVIINVCDEYYADYGLAVMSSGKEYNWFPMCEFNKDMGIVSIYGALTVLYQSWKRDKRVLLHCHAGANRSPTVQACFYFMMTGKHMIARSTNMLSHNLNKHLPDREYMEAFLQRCKEAFDYSDKYIGGMLDWVIDVDMKKNIV